MADQTHVIMLDTLLDTRLATIAKLDGEVAKRIVNDPEWRKKYNSRPCDDFTEFGISKDAFDKAYRERDVTTLMGSLPTVFLFELRNFGSALVQLKSNEPHAAENIRYVINTYPYSDLTPAEVDKILSAIYARIQTIIQIEHVYLSPEDLSPDLIRGANYNGVFFYDFRSWLKGHFGDEIEEGQLDRIPSVTINTAPQFEDLEKLQEAAEYQNPNGEVIDPIEGMKVMFSPIFKLELIGLNVYSIADVSNVVRDAVDYINA